MQTPLTGYPVSPQQRQLWSALGDRRPGPAQLELKIEGPLDPARLRHALDRVVLRHEILRTKFQRQSGMKFPFQLIEDGASIAWTSTDLRSLDLQQQAARIAQFWNGGEVTSLDQMPALRVGLWQLSETVHQLALALSPMCVDSASLNRLGFELSRFYLHPEEPLPDPVQYADYS